MGGGGGEGALTTITLLSAYQTVRCIPLATLNSTRLQVCGRGGMHHHNADVGLAIPRGSAVQAGGGLPNGLQEGGRQVCVPSALMLLVVHKKRP